MTTTTPYDRWVKRTLDLCASATALMILAPVIVAVGILVRLRLGSPVLFRQLRPGLHARPFRILKFRTMANTHNPKGILLPDSERLTPFGGFLRRTSLDELPELWNVLRGDMSLVGPRPLLMQYLERYSAEQARRHCVRPGITGWAQIRGRNALGWEEKFALDVWYVGHMSLWLDLRIIILTAWKILTREGISHPGQATMEEYRGPSAGEESSNMEVPTI